jgi:hypothetical protein
MARDVTRGLAMAEESGSGVCLPRPFNARLNNMAAHNARGDLLY